MHDHWESIFIIYTIIFFPSFRLFGFLYVKTWLNKSEKKYKANIPKYSNYFEKPGVIYSIVQA